MHFVYDILIFFLFILLANSVYGKTITNKEKHQNVSYFTDEQKASRFVADHRFVSLDVLEESFYEGVSEKRKILLDIPITIGFSILQYAKLRMLQFYYECID